MTCLINPDDQLVCEQSIAVSAPERGSQNRHPNLEPTSGSNYIGYDRHPEYGSQQRYSNRRPAARLSINNHKLESQHCAETEDKLFRAQVPSDLGPPNSQARVM